MVAAATVAAEIRVIFSRWRRFRGCTTRSSRGAALAAAQAGQAARPGPRGALRVVQPRMVQPALHRPGKPDRRPRRDKFLFGIWTKLG